MTCKMRGFTGEVSVTPFAEQPVSGFSLRDWGSG